MPESTQAVLWRGGLNTSLDKALIAPNELADGLNFIVRDGTIRLDRRYVQAFDHSGLTGNFTSCSGSGWGKYGTGTLSNQYVAVLNDASAGANWLFEYDLTQSTLTRTFAAGQMADGEWFWQQFANYLYGINATAGIGRKKLGPGTLGHGDWGLISPPAAPAAAPAAPTNSSASETNSFLGSSVVASAGTATYVTAGDYYHCVFTSAHAGAQTVTVTFDTSPDLRPNWGYHDLFQTVTSGSFYPPDLRMGIFSTQLGASSVDAEPLFRQQNTATIDRIANISRANRAQITKIAYKFTVPPNGGYIDIWRPQAHGVWLSLPLSTNATLNSYPTLKPLQYEFTYENETTGLESPPSPVLTIPPIEQYANGEWRDVTCPSTGASGVTHINVYRRIEAGGAITRYKLARLNNAGTQVHTDKLSASEVTGLATFTPSIFPTGSLTAIAAWLNRLVVAAGNVVYISRDNDPLSFVDSTVIYDPQDEARAFTTPVDDRGAENVLGLASEDSLYIVTDYSTRCLFGTTPSNWRLMKVSGSEGAVGPRAWHAYKGGVLVLTPSGRLMFYSIGRDPDEVSAKLKARIGNEGMKALATEDAVVAVTPDGEIEVRNNTGAYYILDVDGNWRGGDHYHPTHSTVFVSGLPLRWFGTDGKLYEGGDDSFVTDGGTSGANGVPVAGYVLTRDERMPRSSVINVYLDAEQTLDPDDTTKTIYPKVTPICRRTTSEGLTAYTGRTGERNLRVGVNAVGEEMQWRIDFDKDSVIREMRVTYNRASDARHT